MTLRSTFWITGPTQKFGIYTDARRFTLLWIKSRLLVAVAPRAAVEDEAVEVQVHRAAAAVQAQPRGLEQVPELVEEERAVQRLLPFLAQRLQRRPVRLLRLAAAVDRPVAVVAVVARVVAKVAVEDEAVVVEHRQLLGIDRAPQFPAWRLLMRCSQRVPIRMWRSARAARKPVPAVVSAIPC
jgi:hypothetical protein